MSFQYNELICVSGNVGTVDIGNAAKTVFFPCDHFGNGCRALLLAKEKLEHEQTCDFRNCVCPYPGESCKWQGPVERVHHHLMTNHNNLATFQGEDHIILAKDINLAGALDWIVIQSCFGQTFVVVLGKQYRWDDIQFHAVVQLIGNREQSQKFTYLLELNGGYQRLVWKGTTRPIHDGVPSAIESGDCLLFDSKTAKICAENECLRMRVIISVAQQDEISPPCIQCNIPVTCQRQDGQAPAVTLHYLPAAPVE